MQPFRFFTNPSENLRVSKGAGLVSKTRPNSLSVLQGRRQLKTNLRYVSAPTNVRSVTPVMEKSPNNDSEDVCSRVATLALDPPKQEVFNTRVGRTPSPDREANPFLKPKRPRSLLPIPATPAPTPVRGLDFDATPSRFFDMPRRSVQPPYLNRFTNDRCPDFYDQRIEAMETKFREFTEKIEGDVQKATKHEEIIKQLKSQGMMLQQNFSGGS